LHCGEPIPVFFDNFDLLCSSTRQLEEQHGCHSRIGTNDVNTMTTAVAAKDELRRQKKQFNKPEEATKFLDVLRISVAPPTAGISSVDLPAREVS